jgi:hypothetical protein
LEIVAIAFFLLTWWIASVSADPPIAKKEKKEVSVKDIREGNVVVIGLLGKPLHEMIHLKGTWKTPEGDKDIVPVLLVNEIEGKELPEPVSFKDYLVKAVDENGKKIAAKKHSDDTWEMEGYEIFTDDRVPEAYSKMLGKDSRAYQQPVGPLRSELVVIVTKRGSNPDVQKKKTK